MADRYLDDAGLEHLIGLIKGADAALKQELLEAISGAGTPPDEVTITLEDGKLAVKDGGVDTAQLADESVTVGKLDLSSVTPDAIGAAKKSHTHAAADIVSGAIPIAHGGTGATTIDGARTVLFNFPDNDELLAYLGLS